MTENARKNKMKLPPQPVMSRPVSERRHDFNPVYINLDESTAAAEAERCLGCPKQPCVTACPLHNNIPAAMQLIADKQFLEAAAVYRQTSPLSEICSRICPQENLCEGACVLRKNGTAVALGKLEQFVGDYARAHQGTVIPPRSFSLGKSVAVVGAGPAGMSAAYKLLEFGYDVTLYEAWARPGGWLTYAIPTYKLPRQIIKDKIADLEQMGAHFVTNTRVGRDISLQAIRDEHTAVFISVGATSDAEVKLSGKELPGVYTGTQFLLPIYTSPDERPDEFQPPAIGSHVVVFGGGDTAMDCVRTAIRMQIQRDLEPQVTLIYRRTEDEMPASRRERKMAHEEGVEFVYLAAPVAFNPGPDGRIHEVVIQRMELGEPDASGRPRPIPIQGSDYTIQTDTVVLALGYWPDPLIGQQTPELQTHQHGLIMVDVETGATNLPGVFAGGDGVRGPSLAGHAAHDGIVAAQAIHDYLS